jgi:hypothetical protein
MRSLLILRNNLGQVSDSSGSIGGIYSSSSSSSVSVSNRYIYSLDYFESGFMIQCFFFFNL